MSQRLLQSICGLAGRRRKQTNIAAEILLAKDHNLLSGVFVYLGQVYMFIYTRVYLCKTAVVNKCISREGKESSCEDEQLRRSEQLRRRLLCSRSLPVERQQQREIRLQNLILRVL